MERYSSSLFLNWEKYRNSYICMYIKAKFNDIFHIVARFPYNSLATPVTERYPSARYDTIHKTIGLSDTHNTNKQIDFTVNEHDSMLILIKQIFSFDEKKNKTQFSFNYSLSRFFHYQYNCHPRYDWVLFVVVVSFDLNLVGVFACITCREFKASQRIF